MTDRLRQLLVIIFISLVSACSSHSPSSSLGELPRTPQGSIQQLLQQADASGVEQAIPLRLSAADQSARLGDLAQARRILDALPLDSLKPAQQIFAYTLQAELAVATNRPEQALQAIQHPSFQRLAELPVEQQVRSHLARARTFEANQQPLAAVRERIYLAPLLNAQPVVARDNHEAIWKLSAGLPAGTTAMGGEADLDGWLSLSTAVRQAKTLSQQQAAIDGWRQQHPNHPAARQLPTPLAKLRELVDQPLSRVALLLPMQGQLANVAQTIRDGFMAAHFQAQQAGQGFSRIKLYDSTRIGSLEAFYKEAQGEGIELVIGPLEKDLVRQLASASQLPIPTLALNYSEGGQTLPPQLFQFGLAAEDEAREVARRAWADGHRRAVALVPTGDWGSRVLEAFRQTWIANGGVLVAAETMAEPAKLPAQIAELFRLRESEARAKRLESSLGTQVSSQPTRRQDVDFLFLAASPQQAQQVRPTMVFQYVGDVPVYATSQSHAATGNRSQYLDLEGIRFTETPWLLNPQLPLRAAVAPQWPQASSSLGRLYAMGADAYLLAPRLKQLQALPDTRLSGLSGALSLNAQQRVERQLPWATFHNGEVIPLAGTVAP